MEIYRFQTCHFDDLKHFAHFANLEKFSIGSHFSNFKLVKIDPSLLHGAGYGSFTSLDKILGFEKQSETYQFDNKFKKHT